MKDPCGEPSEEILLSKVSCVEERDIFNRIRSYHRKAGNILEDWARKASLEIVIMAKRLGYAVAREDLIGLIEALWKLPKKHGAPLAMVDPRGTSSQCPQCDTKLEENGYKRLKCPR